MLPDGVLSGWLGQSANAHAFAMRHFSTSQKSQAEGGEGAADNATAGAVKHYTSFKVCGYQGCPFKGKAHSHCLACRCPDPDAKTHRHHRCGFAAGSAEAVPMPDGTLAGWSGRSRWNCEMHVQHYHSNDGRAEANEGESVLQQWASRHASRVVPRAVAASSQGQLASSGVGSEEWARAAGAPGAGESVRIGASDSAQPGGFPHWTAVATGKTAHIAGELFVELRLPTWTAALWRPLAGISRRAASVEEQHVSHRSDESLVRALAPSVSAGASSGILQCIRNAHGRQVLPAVRHHEVGDWEVPTGCDVAFREAAGDSSVFTWGRVLQKDAAA